MALSGMRIWVMCKDVVIDVNAAVGRGHQALNLLHSSV
jgi:hypothetical protein